VLSLNLIENAKALGAEDAAQEIPAEVLALVEQRKEARKAKDFAQADALRDQIAALGWQIRETRQGTEITKI
jgi:cysteinyl-tRNA synthetase